MMLMFVNAGGFSAGEEPVTGGKQEVVVQCLRVLSRGIKEGKVIGG